MSKFFFFALFLLSAVAARADCDSVPVPGRETLRLSFEKENHDAFIRLHGEGESVVSQEKLQTVGRSSKCLSLRFVRDDVALLEYSQGATGTQQLIEQTAIQVIKVRDRKLELDLPTLIRAVDISQDPNKTITKWTYKVAKDGKSIELVNRKSRKKQKLSF
jgi:hypothetical protein